MSQLIVMYGTVMNSLKWVMAIGLMTLAVAGNYYFADHSLVVRSLSALGVMIVSGAILCNTEGGKRFWRFAQEARGELRKVVWPDRQETIRITLMVLVVAATVGILLWIIDILLLKGIALLTGYGAP